MIPKIAGEDPASLLRKYDEFQEAFQKTFPSAPRDWCVAIEESLLGKAKAWKDYAALKPPGSDLYRQAIMPDCPDNVAEEYYRFVRAALFNRAGLQYENPGEISKKDWEQMVVPKEFSSRRNWMISWTTQLPSIVSWPIMG